MGTILDERRLARAVRLRAAASATTGLDHIDIQAARARGIRVLSLHGAHTAPTAEHAIALLLALARRILPSHARTAGGGWRTRDLFGAELAGKTLGIVGLGRIGMRVARLARGLGLSPLAYDPYRKGWPRGVERTRRLDDLLPRSDFLTLHVPLTGETRGMIGTRELARLPRGAFLVNTARGGVVSTPALLAALREGRLAGAGIDVYETEPPNRLDPLLRYARRHGNLLLTPHLAASTRETVERVARATAVRLLAALGLSSP